LKDLNQLAEGLSLSGHRADDRTKMGRVFRITNKLSKNNFCNNVAKPWKALMVKGFSRKKKFKNYPQRDEERTI
jgi:hypothetical protein